MYKLVVWGWLLETPSQLPLGIRAVLSVDNHGSPKRIKYTVLIYHYASRLFSGESQVTATKTIGSFMKPDGSLRGLR
jgi:hypothetical protein